MNPQILLCLAFFFSINLNAQNLYFPPLNGSDWETIEPSSLGWCEENIDSLYHLLEAEETKSFLILKDGKIVLEKYFGSYTQDSLWFWFSAAKSLRAVLVGIAQEEGHLDIQDRSADYLGEGWTSLPIDKENEISIWHQLTMTSGLNEGEFSCTSPECLTYVADAGTRWVYHNSPYNLLRNVLETATGQTINAYTRTRVKNKIGMSSGLWLAVGDNTYFFSRARDMARFGLLVQAKGSWDGDAVLGDTAYINQMVNTSQNLNPSYGYLWWLNGKDSHIAPGSPQTIAGPIAPAAPADVYAAAGASGQFISISPNKGLIMIRQGLSGSNDLVAIEMHNNIWDKIMDLECTTTSQTEKYVNTIRLAPNPTNGMIYLSGFEHIVGANSISIYDLLGRIVKEIPFATSLDLSDLPKGTYLLQIRDKGALWSQKILKY